MADVSHANPYTGESLGTSFMRGVVAVDGGHTDETQTMRDVSHEPPNGEGTNGVWKRGTVRRDHAAATDGNSDVEPKEAADE